MTQTTSRPSLSTHATKVLEQTYLSDEELLERFALPGDVTASAIAISPRAKIEENKDGEVQVRFNSDKNATHVLAGKEAIESLVKFIGVSPTLVKDYPSKLTLPLLSHGLARKEGAVAVIDGEGRLLNVSDQAKLKPVMAAEQVLEHIREQWPEVQWQDGEISSPKGDRAYGADLIAITHNDVERLERRVDRNLHQRLPEGGDPYRAGIHAHFNPMGITEPLIEPYIQRLVCLNGAIHSEYLSHEWGRGFGEGDDLWQWFRDGLIASNVAIGGVMDKYAEMVGQTFETGTDRARAVEGFIRSARLTREDAQAVRDGAIANPPETQYDLFQLATATATHGGSKSLEQLLNRQRVAASTASHPHIDRFCPTCNRN